MILRARTCSSYSWKYASKGFWGVTVSERRWQTPIRLATGTRIPPRESLPSWENTLPAWGRSWVCRSWRGAPGWIWGKGEEERGRKKETKWERRCWELCHDWGPLNLQKVKNKKWQNVWCDCPPCGNLKRFRGANQLASYLYSQREKQPGAALEGPGELGGRLRNVSLSPRKWTGWLVKGTHGKNRQRGSHDLEGRLEWERSKKAACFLQQG